MPAQPCQQSRQSIYISIRNWGSQTSDITGHFPGALHKLDRGESTLGQIAGYCLIYGVLWRWKSDHVPMVGINS